MAYLIPPLGIALTEPSRCLRHCRFALKGSCKFRSGFADCERAFSRCLRHSNFKYNQICEICFICVNLRVAKRRLIAPKSKAKPSRRFRRWSRCKRGPTKGNLRALAANLKALKQNLIASKSNLIASKSNLIASKVTTSARLNFLSVQYYY